MKKYCFNCGTKMEFSASSKPKFCFNCGTPLDSSTASRPIADVDSEDYGDDGESNVSVSSLNIDALDFDFDKSLLEAKGQKIGAVVGTLDGSKIGDSGDTPKGPSPSYGKEEFQQEEDDKLEHEN